MLIITTYFCYLCLIFGSREKALQDGLKAAVQVPLKVIKTATEVWGPMVELAKIGNINSKSDLQVRTDMHNINDLYFGAHLVSFQ